VNKQLIEALQNLRLANPFAPLETPFLMLAFLFAVIGYAMTVIGEKQDHLRPVVRTTVACIFIAAVPLWTGLVRDGVYYLPYSLLDYHTGLEAVYQNITNAVNSAIDSKALDFSLFDALGSVIMDFIVVVLMRTIATIGSLIAIPLLFVQIGADQFCVTIMPLAIAGLTVPAIRNQCQGFIAFWVSVLLWPLFFAVVTIIASTVFSVSNNLTAHWLETLTGGGFIGNFIAPFAAGLILLGGIISTPPLAYSLCAHGGAALSGPSVTSLITTTHLIR